MYVVVYLQNVIKVAKKSPPGHNLEKLPGFIVFIFPVLISIYNFEMG